MTQGTVGNSPVTQTSPPLTAGGAGDVAQGAKDSGVQVAQTAAEQAKSVASEAKRQTRNLLGEAQGQLREQAEGQQQRVKEGLRSLGDELRSMADTGEQSGMATELAHQAAQRAHGAADWLDQRHPGDLLDEVRQFARRRPGAFLFGALVAGVVAGRLTRGLVAAQSDDANDDAPGLSDALGRQDVEPSTTAGLGESVSYRQSPSVAAAGERDYLAPAELDQALAADPLWTAPRHADAAAADPLSQP